MRLLQSWTLEGAAPAPLAAESLTNTHQITLCLTGAKSAHPAVHCTGRGLEGMHGVLRCAASACVALLRHRPAAVRRCMPLLVEANRGMVAAMAYWGSSLYPKHGASWGKAQPWLSQCAAEMARWVTRVLSLLCQNTSALSVPP